MASNIPIEYQLFFNRSIGRILTGPTTLDQSGPGSNSHKVILHTPQISRGGASQSDLV